MSYLETCLSLESLSELQKLELNLSLTSLWNHCHPEHKDANLPDLAPDLTPDLVSFLREMYDTILETLSSIRQSGEYLFWVDENNIEDDIRDGLASSQARAPGRNTEIIITGYGACVQEKSPFA